MLQNPIRLIDLSDFNRISGEKVLKNVLIIVCFGFIAWLHVVTSAIVDKPRQNFACSGDEDIWVVELYLYAFWTATLDGVCSVSRCVKPGEEPPVPVG
jgi:hypothetical protein